MIIWALRNLRAVLAALLGLVALWATGRPVWSDAGLEKARAFRFERRALAEPADRAPKSIRRVHPSLSRIASWISAVGAATALADIDGDGLPNEACHVDPRFDDVRISSVDGPQRFAPFTLPLHALRYDDTMAPMGCLPGDFNEDGRTDLLVYFWGRTPIVYLQRQHPGTLAADAFVAQELIVPDRGERWFTNAVTRADLDGDGHADLVVANYFADGARILDAAATGPAQAMPHSLSRANNGGRVHLLLWTSADASPTSPQVSYAAVDDGVPGGLGPAWTLAVGAADLDGDLLPELYFANDFAPDVLLHNRSTPGHVRFERVIGRRTFWTPASKVLGRDSFKGMGVDFGDINGDGYPDIFVSNITESYALEESQLLFISHMDGARSRGMPRYVDESEALGVSRSGWAWDAKLDDFDNDGDLELVQATGFLRGERWRWAQLQELATSNDQLVHNPQSWPRFLPGDDISGHDTLAFFTRRRDGRYENIATRIGFEPHVSRGLAIADVNGDGLLDLAVANQWEPSFLFVNRAPAAGHFVGLHLRRPLDRDCSFTVHPGHPAGDRTTTPAIGAAVELWADGRLIGAREVDGGNGHSGKRSPDLHFGLGTRSAPVRVVVRWRDARGTPQRATFDVAPGWHTVVLGEH